MSACPCVAAEIHHVADGGGDRAVDLGHDENAEKVENGAHPDRRPHVHAAGGDAGSNGVGRIGPAIDENHTQRQQDSDQQRRARRHLLQEIGKRYIHISWSFLSAGRYCGGRPVRAK